MRMMKKKKKIVFWKILKIAIEEGKKKLIIKKWTSKDIEDENDEKGRNIAFWKILEEGKKKLIIKKWISKDIDENDEEGKIN